MRQSSLSPLGLAALEYAADRGWPIFPLHDTRHGRCSCGDAGCERAGKHPRTVNGFLDASTHPEQIGACWDQWPTANIGFRPGAGDLLVIDIDGAEAAAKALTLGILTTNTVTVQTSRGHHAYFMKPRNVVITNASPWKADGIDIRGDKGFVVLPPSVHASGRTYAWCSHPDDVAPIPPSVLDLIVSHQQRDSVQSVSSDVDRLEKHAATLQALVAEGRRQGLSKDLIADRLDQRIQKYLATVGIRSEGDRNDTAYRVARWLSNDFKLSDDVAFAYLAEWNTGNAPPLSERELRLTFKSAKRSGQRSAGCAHQRHGSVA